MNPTDSLFTHEHFTNLIQFRQAVYHQLGPARDSLFELTDAMLQMDKIHSFVELSCAPAFHRRWASTYAALHDSRIDGRKLFPLYVAHLPTPLDRLLVVVDHTAWPRLWSLTLPGRSYQHQSTTIPGRRPVTIGLGYSSVVVVPEPSGSWVLPLLHERIAQQKPVQTAAEQLAVVCPLLSQRPIVLLDSEYACATLLLQTADVPADLLLRLRTNLCLEGPTKPYAGRGRHPQHGIPFKLKDPQTWWQPDQVIEEQDPVFGPVRIQLWFGLRFRKALHRTMIVARIERLQGPDTRRKPKVIWLAWVGEEPPVRWWRKYARRYPVEHWYRFIKGRLHWMAPHFSGLAVADRWSHLMGFLSWEVWLAREGVQDRPLPWQKPQQRLSPGRVCQGMGAIFATIGTPTRVCKSRGKSPGWPKGKARTPRQAQDVIRSAQWQTIRARQKAKSPPKTASRGRPKQPTAALPA